MRAPPSRSPGVAGFLPHSRPAPGSHSPPIATRGPLGLAFIPDVVAAPGPVVASTKAATRRNTLPAPEEKWTSANKIPKRLHRPLFAKGGPAVADIRQQGIGNCYLAGVLGAMANTPKGRGRLVALVNEHAGAILTTAHDYVDQKPGPSRTIPADRYFEVTFPGAQAITVSDVLYADDSDRDWSPIFMDSPNNVLWPSIVELAYATSHRGYDKIGMGSGVSVATCIAELLGQVDYTMLHFLTNRKYRGSTDGGALKSKDLQDVCMQAGSRATMAATRDDATGLIGNHAYVVLRASGSSVTLYEPLHAKPTVAKLAELPDQLEAVFSIVL